MSTRLGAAAVVLLAASVHRGPSAADRTARPPRRPQRSRSRACPTASPNLQGIWQVRNRAAYDLEDHHGPTRHAGRPQRRRGRHDSVSAVGAEEAATRTSPSAYTERSAQQVLHARRAADHVHGVPVPHLPDAPTHVAITFEWSQVHRLIHTNGSKPGRGIDFWMGDSRGRWEGDTLVVDVTNHNDKTWFDMAGNFHSEAMQVVERYTMTDADTIRYEVTIEDPEGLHAAVEDQHADLPAQGHGPHPRVSVPARRSRKRAATSSASRRRGTRRRAECRMQNAEWAPMALGAVVRLPASRSATRTRRVRHRRQQAEAPGAAGSAGRRTRQGAPEPGRSAAWPTASPICRASTCRTAAARTTASRHTRTGLSDARRTRHHRRSAGRQAADAGVGAGRAEEPAAARTRLRRPDRALLRGGRRAAIDVRAVAVCILQPPAYVVVLFERMSWRSIPLDGRKHLPDSIRLWQGDSVGRWDGDTLVVETAELERQDVAERGGRDREPRPARSSSGSRRSMRLPFITGPRSPIRSSTRGRGRCDSAQSRQKDECSKSRATRTIRICST